MKKSELVPKKLRIAREYLGMSQKMVERVSGYLQSAVSALESGSASYVPYHYLDFLSQKGVDLSALFNETVSPDKFKDICYGKDPRLITTSVACEKCAVKDKEIDMLKAHNEDLRFMLRGKPAEQPASGQ